MKLLLIAALIAAAFAYFAAPAEASDERKRPMKVEDLFALKRVADPQISPDGKSVVYQVTSVSLAENKSSTALWLAATDGKTPPKAFTNPNGKKDTHPRWSPDGKQILFSSTRSGSQQLWLVGLGGGEAQQITSISTGADNGLWSQDGSHVGFVSAVHPEFSELPFGESDKKNAAKDKEIEDNPVKAKTFTKLFYRHWDEYVGDKRQHLFVMASLARKGGDSAWGAPHDCTPGDRDANPTSSTFSVGDDFTFTPDSKHLVFTATPAENESWSTNYDLCRVSIGNKSTKWEVLTGDNKAADNSPRFSPNGKKLAWRAQKKAGYEADKWDILVVDVKQDGTFAGKPKNATSETPHSINEFVWGDQDWFFWIGDEKGYSHVFWTDTEGETMRCRQAGQHGSLHSTPKVPFLVCTDAGMDRPAEICIMTLRKASEILTHHNAELLATLDRTRPESVQVKIEDGEMQMWILKPPGFDPKKKWPVAYLIHGGPQGAWEDGWSNRWNPQLWAAQGYVVAMPNPRGSTGFGQKFVDQISGDWGGKCYRDLVAGLDFVEKLEYVDKDRIGTAGASFGGYMQNWFAVSPIAKRFKCQISHCSVWNFESMWGTTDELWFDEWEHQGLPWEKPGSYAEFSPHKKAGELAKHKTPMLVIHNDNDFRCPIGQGHELFTALQRNKVPSRFVNFPDEGHWVLKPKNSERWHKEVFDWLAKYCPPGGK